MNSRKKNNNHLTLFCGTSALVLKKCTYFCIGSLTVVHCFLTFYSNTEVTKKLEIHASSEIFFVQEVSLIKENWLEFLLRHLYRHASIIGKSYLTLFFNFAICLIYEPGMMMGTYLFRCPRIK